MSAYDKTNEQLLVEIHLLDKALAAALDKNKEIENILRAHKQNEESFWQSKERLDLALCAANEGLWDLEVSTGQLFFSPHWAKMLGFNSEQVPRSIDEWKALIFPGDLDRVIQALNEHLQGALPYYSCEYRIRSGSGAWVWVLGHGRVVSRGHDGKPARLIGMTQDISARKQADELIRKLSQAIEFSGQSTMITDNNGFIEYVNPAFTTITGYDAEEVIGQTPRLLNSGNQDAAFYESMWHTIKSGYVWCSKVIDKRKDGSYFPAILKRV